MRDHTSFLWRFFLFALPFWSADHKWRNPGRLALIAALTVAQVAVQVGLNSWSARLYNAIEGRHLDAFLDLITTFVLLLLASIPVFSITLYTKRRLEFAWRVWITKNTLSVWVAQGRHYQLGLVAGEHGDNPDGRIAEDIRLTTEQAVELGQAAFYCILLFGTFVTVLWTLSGVIHVDIGGTVIPIPAKFIRPGSMRIHSSEVDQLPNVACLTPDPRMVMLVMNDTDGARRCRIRHRGACATLALGAGDVATLRWNAATAVARGEKAGAGRNS